MKKYTLIAVIVALSVFNVVVGLAQDPEPEGNAGCQSLANCSGQALCNSPGQSSGCSIACNNGAQITCPRP